MVELSTAGTGPGHQITSGAASMALKPVGTSDFNLDDWIQKRESELRRELRRIHGERVQVTLKIEIGYR